MEIFSWIVLLLSIPAFIIAVLGARRKLPKKHELKCALFCITVIILNLLVEWKLGSFN